MPLVRPLKVTVLPNVTSVALALIVRLGFGFVFLGGFAATAGPAQTSTAASAAPSFFIPHKRSSRPQVGGPEKEEAPGGASSSACCAGRRRRSPRSTAVRRRSRGRCVLELLLGAEERVERLLAQTLAEHERKADADDDQHQAAA